MFTCEKECGLFGRCLQFDMAGEVRTDRNGNRERLELHRGSVEGQPVVAR